MTLEELESLLAELGGQMVLKLMMNLPEARKDSRPQDESKASYTHKITKGHNHSLV